MSAEWVSGLNALSAWVLESLWRATWQGAVVITLVWAVCRVWRRMPSALRCLLWAVACLRVLICLTPTSLALPLLPGTPLPPSEPLVVSPVQPVAVSAIRMSDVPVPPIRIADETTPVSWSVFLVTGWLVGVLVVAGYVLRQIVRSARMVRAGTPCTESALMADASEIARKLGLRVRPRVLMTNQAETMMTFGAFRPVVLLSSPALAHCSAEERRMVLAHEFAHVRRRDAWLGLVPQFAQTLLFFHPLVRLACREFEIAREAACDQAALSSLQIGSELYGRLLLKLVTGQPSVTTLCTPGVSSHFKLLGRRIVMLEKATEKTPVFVQRRSALLAALACVLCIAPISIVAGQSESPVKVAVISRSHAVTTKAKPSAPLSKLTKLARTSTIKAKQVMKVQPVAPKPIVPVAQSPVLRVYRLKYAQAARLAAILRNVLDLAPSLGGRVAADSQTNSLVVALDEKRIAQVADVIKNLDVSTEADQPHTAAQPVVATQLKIYTLQYARAATMQQLLMGVFGGQASLTADLRTNSLVVNAPQATLDTINKVIIQLDRPVSGAAEGQDGLHNKLYKIPAAQFKTFGNTVGSITGTIDTVSYGGDENFFIVRGTAAQLARVDQLERSMRASD